MTRTVFKNLIAAIVLIAVLTSVNWLWMLKPARTLDIVVLDKNVRIDQIDRHNNLTGEYRKHRGLFWILNNQKFVKPVDGGMYDYRKDYFGPVLDSSNNKIGLRDLEKPAETADLLYLADAYGDEDSDSTARGITAGDLDVISKMYQDGTKVIGEFNISGLPTSAEIRSSLEDIFGIDFSGWCGRYVDELNDDADVPEWARMLYKKQHGRTWDLAGSGLLIVSDKESLIVLQEGVDYDEGTLKVEILPLYACRFGDLSVSYYNWFEVVVPRKGTEVIADYTLSLTAAGKTRVSGVFTGGRFAAVTRRADAGRSAYYFAGEFSDYVEQGDIYYSVIAARLNNLFSQDRRGNITNFFWKFYIPVVGVLLDEAYQDKPAA
ncbi:MAG: hypothetical protein ACYC5K_00365 [Saccharofermentanales bacterium]